VMMQCRERQKGAIRRHMQCSKLGVVVLFSYRGSLAGAL
jgi:hypothetical protein